MDNDSKLSICFAEGGAYEPLPDQGPLTSGTAGPPLKFLKDTLPDGSYKHPELGWTLDVDQKRRQKLCRAFAEMAANGTKVPIYADHNPGSNNHLGYITDMFNGGDPQAFARNPCLGKLPEDKMPLDPTKLYTIHEFSDTRCADLGCRVGQVSPLIDKDMKDGQHSYGEAIRHVAITPEPVISGQGGFTQLAASRKISAREDASVFVLSGVSNHHSNGNGAKTMLTADELKTIQTALGEEGKNVTAENGVAAMCTALSKLATSVTDLTKKADDQKQIAASLQTKLDENGPKTVDADILDQLAEGAEERIEGLTLGPKPKITPAVAKSLKALLVGESGSRNAYALSRSVSGTPKSLVKQVVEALEGNDPVVLGEQSKSQTLGLSRQVPGTEGSQDDPKVTSSMVAMAGGAAE
jgi:hypothetical protein